MRGMLIIVAASFLLIGSGTGAPSPLAFTGELQRVTAVSISVRLSDGRIIEAQNDATRGDLTPQNLARKYTVGDRVEISCTAFRGLYSSLIGRRLTLELKKLRFLRTPTREERAKALTSKAWRQSPNLLIVEADPYREASPLQPPLDQIRSQIVKFVSTLPNFVADEVAKRYVSTTIPPDWRLGDTIESEITFKGSTVSRKHILVDGKPWNATYRELPGFKWTDAFGSQLTYLFDPNCPTTFELDGAVVKYSSPPDGCEFFWHDYQQFYPVKTGRIVLDGSGENVMRLETNSRVFPEAFPIRSSEKQVSWDSVKIGDATHVLPVSAEIKVVLSTGEMRMARHEYTNHRHFEAASNVTFH